MNSLKAFFQKLMSSELNLYFQSSYKAYISWWENLELIKQFLAIIKTVIYVVMPNISDLNTECQPYLSQDPPFSWFWIGVFIYLCWNELCINVLSSQYDILLGFKKLEYVVNINLTSKFIFFNTHSAAMVEIRF